MSLTLLMGKKGARHQLQSASHPKYISVRGVQALKYMRNLCLAVTRCQSDRRRVSGEQEHKDKYETACVG